MQNGLLADFCNQASRTCNGYLGGLTMDRCMQFYQHLDGITDVSMYADGTNLKFPLMPTAGSSSALPCRRYHVQVGRDGTATEAMQHCTHALFGAEQCGTNCATYCMLGEAICPDMFDTNCITDCANKVPAAMDYMNISNPDIVCRMYHLSVASTPGKAAEHCPHTTIMSTPDKCGTAGAATLSVSALFIAALTLITKFSS
jgi:hypothetical protein